MVGLPSEEVLGKFWAGFSFEGIQTHFWREVPISEWSTCILTASLESNVGILGTP
jgi:hypothetical protein